MIGADNRLISDGTHWYLYDAEGNRIARFIDNNHSGSLTTGDAEVTEYAWDNRNRLTEVSFFADYASYSGHTPTKVVDYIYDVENRWIGETIDLDGDGVIDHQTRFAYDGNQIVLQFDKDGTGDVTGENLSHRYLYGPAIDQILSDEVIHNGSTEQVRWPLTDNLNTVRDVAVYNSATGATTVANHIVYDSYGNIKSQSNPAVDCLFGFTGRPTDKATGLQNNLNRWYDPKVGRWINRDPIGFEDRDTNLYRYCGNSPTNSADPSGLHWYYLWTDDLWYGFKKAVGYGNPIKGAGIATANVGVLRVAEKATPKVILQAKRQRWMNLTIKYTNPNHAQSVEIDKAYKDYLDEARKKADDFNEEAGGSLHDER